VFKPATGTTPPPSVVNALTKKLGRVTLPEEQTSPPTLGLVEEVKTTKIPRPKSKTAETPAEPAPNEQPVDEPSAQVAPRRILPGLIYASAVLALLMIYYVWSPYHAASSLRNALNEGDPAQLDAAIDFSSVRASMKEQIKNQIAQSALPVAKSNSSTDSASSIVLSILDQSIDLYVTPEGISRLVNKSDSFSKEEQAPTISSGVAAKILLAFNSQPIRNQGLASLDDFVLDCDAAMLHLQFQGMGWKLKRVDLRPDLGLPGPSGSAAPLLSPVVDTYLERGNAKSKNGDWNGAVADFTRVLAIDPQSSVAYNDRGTARQSKGDLDGAIKDYTQALTIAPQMAAAFDSRGNAKAARNDLDSAIADYTQAVQLDPTLAVAYDSRGNAKTAKEDLDGAIADFTQAITIDPNLASAYSDRGFARQANGNLDGAISDYTQALALKPKTAIAYYNRGLARQSQGNLEEAIVDYDRALAFDPKIAGAYFNRGNAKNAIHDLDGAIADYTQAVTLNPKIALAYCNRGMARQATGDLDGAVADYTRALAVDPKIAVAYYNRAVIEAQKKDLDGAIADSSQALDLDPKNAQAYSTRGFAKLAKGNLDGALADLQQFCDLNPRDRDADHARLYLWLIAKEQNATDADQELSDALENSWNSSPDDQVSKTAAFLLGRMNEADYLAAAASPDAKTDQGQHCEAWYFAGMKRLLMGDKTTAIDYFHKCLATGQNDYCEYLLAQAELQALEPTPAPTPTTGTAPVKKP
jgi:tetratricopeptide (TPR) repeat protein